MIEAAEVILVFVDTDAGITGYCESMSSAPAQAQAVEFFTYQSVPPQEISAYQRRRRSVAFLLASPSRRIATSRGISRH